MDLMALADCLLLPDDDLALASVLQEPAVRPERGAVVRHSPATARDRCARACAASRLLPQRAARSTSSPTPRAQLTPFAFFAHVLGAQRGRAKILARLGPEANDALDEFLNLALDYETARDAVAAGLPRLAARGAKRSEARHGDGARRGAGDDRARRQGAGSAHRHPRRHHDPADRPERSAAARSCDNGALVWATARSARTSAP